MNNTTRKNRILKRAATMLLAFAVAFTMIPFAAGDLDVLAASKITVKKVAVGQTSIKISWSKISKPGTGYAIYRNDKVVKRVTKKTSAYLDQKLKSSTTYKYYVRSYTQKTKKVKMWYNKKTKKWQTKKPPKKQRGKSKKVKKVTYKYGTKSNTLAIRTAAKPASKPTSSTSQSSSGGSTSGGNNNTGGNNGSNTSGTDQVRTGVNYRGKTRTLRKTAGQDFWICEETNAVVFDSDLWAYDRTIDGGNEYYKQVSDATFTVSGGGPGYTYGSLASPQSYYYGGEMAEVYNVEPDKLRVEPGDGISIDSVDTYIWDQDTQTKSPIERSYIVKDGKRIALAKDKDGNLGKIISYAGGTHLVACVYGEYGGVPGGTGIGIFNGTYSLKVYYDDKYVGEMNFNSCSDAIAATGMSPRRSRYYAVAETAIAEAGGSTDSILGDYRIIADYIEANIVHDSTVSTEYGNIDTFNCIAAAGVLETWLIYNYGDEGMGFFAGDPSQPVTHFDYYLNSNPNGRLAVFFKPES